MVGAGAAGLYVALRAAEAGARVALVSRKRLAETVSESASYWAQGGLAAALGPDDSPGRHAQDTLEAGRGLCRTAAVETLADEAPGAVEELRRPRGRLRHPSPTARWRWPWRAATPRGRIVHAGGSATGQRDHRLAASSSPPSLGSRFSNAPRLSPCGATASAAPG